MLTTAFTVWQTRLASREDRRQLRLADTYLSLTDHALRIAQYARTAMPGIDDDHPLRDPPFSEADWLRLRAEVAAFASDSVRSQFEELLIISRRTETMRQLWETSLEQIQRDRGTDDVGREEGRKTLESLRSLRAELEVAADSIVQSIRTELLSTAPSGRSAE